MSKKTYSNNRFQRKVTTCRSALTSILLLLGFLFVGNVEAWGQEDTYYIRLADNQYLYYQYDGFHVGEKNISMEDPNATNLFYCRSNGDGTFSFVASTIEKWVYGNEGDTWCGDSQSGACHYTIADDGTITPEIYKNTKYSAVCESASGGGIPGGGETTKYEKDGWEDNTWYNIKYGPADFLYFVPNSGGALGRGNVTTKWKIITDENKGYQFVDEDGNYALVEGWVHSTTDGNDPNTYFTSVERSGDTYVFSRYANNTTYYLNSSNTTRAAFTLTTPRAPAPWFVDYESYLEFAETDGTTTYLHAGDDGTLSRIIAEDNPEKWTVEMDDEETGFYLKNAEGKYIKLDGGELKATATSKSDAALFPKANETDNQSNSTLRLWLDDTHYVNASGQQGTGADMKLVQTVVVPKEVPWKYGKMYHIHFSGGYLDVNNGQLSLASTAEDVAQWQFIKVDGGYVLQNDFGGYVSYAGNYMHVVSSLSDAQVFTDFDVTSDGQIQLFFFYIGEWSINIYLNKQGSEQDGGASYFTLEPVRPTTYWDETDWYYIEFQDYDPESSIYGKYLYQPKSGDNQWRLQRGKAETAQRWYVETTEEGYILRRHDEDGGGYFSWTESATYYHISKKPSEAFVFTDILRSGLKYALWAQTTNGTHYLNADTWASSYDSRSLEKDKTDLKGVMSFFKLVKEVNDDPIPESHEVSEKEIKHRVHQLVKDAQSIGSVPQGFLDGSKEWEEAYGHQYQYTSVYEVTCYVRPGERTELFFPMIQYGSTILHRDYQRFYNYRTDGLLPDGVLDLGGVRTVKYLNSLVTGIRIKQNTLEEMPQNYVDNSFFATLPVGRSSIDIACDVSNFTDMIWDSDGDIDYEPSISQRVIWHLRSADELARQLEALDEGKFLEEKTIHFPDQSVYFEPDCVGLERELRNYWFYQGGALACLGADNNALSIELDANGTGIRLLANYQRSNYSGQSGIAKHIRKEDGLVYNNHKSGGTDNYVREDARFFSFIYPNGGVIPENATGIDHAATISVYANGDKRYRVAKFTLVFDKGTATLPWSDVLTDESNRSPMGLTRRTGKKPIASITFDYPKEYENSVEGVQNINVPMSWAGGENVNIPLRLRTFKSSQLALDFSNANYIHSTKWYDDANGWKEIVPGNNNSSYQFINRLRPVMPATHNAPRYATDNSSYFYDCKWGEYVLTSETGFWNALGPFYGVNNYEHQQQVMESQQWNPAEGMVPGFLYVDASERAGRIVTVPFEGNFCAGNLLYCSGWITTGTLYGWNGGAAPSSVMLNLVGRDYNEDGSIRKEEVLYRFCPGQISLDMRHSNRSVEIVTDGDWNNGNGWIMSNIDWRPKDARTPWQQFYFEFKINETYDRYFLDVDNNCVSTTGGDIMLDDIMVFASVPDVQMEEAVPLCVRRDGDYDVELLKQLVNFDVQLEVVGETEATTAAEAEGHEGYMSFAFVEKDLLLNTFKEKAGLTDLSIEEIEKNMEDGVYESAEYNEAYREAFWAALVGDKTDLTRIWKSTDDSETALEDCGLLQFEWSTYFQGLPEYRFVDAINKEIRKPLYRYIREENGVKMRYLLFNANMPNIHWKVSTDYYIIAYNEKIEGLSNWNQIIPESFDLRSPCNKYYSFRLRPSLDILAIDELEGDDELEACENQIPTIVTDLSGYTAEGEKVDMQYLNFDWWIGRRPGTNGPEDEGVKATLENFSLYKDDAETTNLREALLSFRQHYPNNSTLDGVEPEEITGEQTVVLTQEMIDLLREAVADGQLILRTKLLNTKVYKWSDDDPNFYFVAAPIVDDEFKNMLNPEGEPVVYYCDEPQQLRVMVNNVAPTLESGFTGGMNGISEYDYSGATDALSLRLARMGQFQKVQRGKIANGSALGTSDLQALKCMVMPLREAHGAVADAIGVYNDITDATLDNYIRLVGTTDEAMRDKMLRDVHGDASTAEFPAVGQVVSLEAVDTEKDKTTVASDVNYMRFFFLDNFDVRDGYEYTLKVPFLDKTRSEDSNACPGDMLIKLKIVPDYEVWTGGDGNTDWNNDKNWRRADSDDLLLREEGYAPNTEQTYLTNTDNGNSDGFAPLYCTHIMIKTDEGLQRPELYDMYGNGRTLEDGTVVSDISTLDDTPFPNLNPETATKILKYDFQACPYQEGKHGFGYANDLVAEMYDINLCEDIVFQSRTELLNSYLLDYKKAWVEYSLSKNLWHLVGSPLQDMVSGEWYAPSWSARQETTYYEPVHFDDVVASGALHVKDGVRYDAKYDRFSPAVYQRAWDKARAVVYEHGADWSADDGKQEHTDDEYAGQGNWSWFGNKLEWNDTSSDDYLERLVYKPFGPSKANVAIQGTWSGVYNDHTVPYSNGGFSVMPINTLKQNDADEDEMTLFRLPKEDQFYDIWDWNKGYDVENRVRVYIDDGRALPEEANADNTLELKNRGRLRSDFFAEKGVNGIEKGKILQSLAAGKEYEVTLKNEGNGSLGFFLAENPFICGLDMEEFFRVNADLPPFYLVMRTDGLSYNDEYKDIYEQTIGRGNRWQWTDLSFRSAYSEGEMVGDKIVPPRHAFFIRTAEGGPLNELTVKFTPNMMVRTPQATDDDGGAKPYFAIHAQRDGWSSEARVYVSDDASNNFLPEEDMETFVVSDVTSAIPMVYTLTGRLATSINRLHDFSCLPLGIESDSDSPTTLTFSGVEQLGQGVQLYDALLQTFTRIENGTRLSVPGSTQGRFFLVSAAIAERATEPAVSVFATEGRVHVVSAGEVISDVRVCNAAGQEVYMARPGTHSHVFSLTPAVYIVRAKAGDRSCVRKLVVR